MLFKRCSKGSSDCTGEGDACEAVASDEADAVSDARRSLLVGVGVSFM